MMALARLRCRVSGEIIADVLILGGKRAVVAVFAESHVDYEIPFLHDQILLALGHSQNDFFLRPAGRFGNDGILIGQKPVAHFERRTGASRFLFRPDTSWERWRRYPSSAAGS